VGEPARVTIRGHPETKAEVVAVRDGVALIRLAGLDATARPVGPPSAAFVGEIVE
jgi:hypothetical protein